MLEWIRKKFKGIIILFITGIITLVFVLGSTSFLLNRNVHNKIIAKVDDYDINIDLVNAIYAEHIKKYATRTNKIHIDPTKLKNHIVKDLINQSAIISGLKKAGFIVNYDEIIQFIKNNPQFQENGNFSLEKYTSFFKHAPFTEIEYQQYIKDHLLQQQFHNSIFLSNFVSTTEINNFITEAKQTRDFGFVVVPYKKFVTQNIKNNQITAQEIEDYYNQNKNLFIHPEAVTIKYLDINKNNFIDEQPVEQNTLFKYYQEHIHYYTLPELINVKHILVTKDKTTIEEILSKLKAGAKFAELAKKYSQDPNSAQTGGELGWLGKGETDPEFEQAAFALQNSGDVSNVVTSSFGYHIIQLNQRRPAQIKKFEDLIPDLTKHYKEEMANTKLQNITDEIENGNFEDNELGNIANKFNLSIKSIGPFTNKGEASGIASYNQVIIAAFDEKHLSKNSQLIKLNDDRFVVLKVVDKQPATTKTLAEATNEIKEILQKNLAIQQAQQQGLTVAKQLLTNTGDKIVKLYGLKWVKINNATRYQQINNLDAQILKTAFSLTTKHNQTTFTMDNGDFIIVKLLNIHNLQDLSKQPIQEINQQLTTMQAILEQRFYEQDLIKDAKIKFFNKEVLNDKEQI